MRVEILCVVVLSLLATFIAAKPALERWHDRLGTGGEWAPTGQVAVVARDAHGRALPSGPCALVVMSECSGCSFNSIPLERVLELRQHGKVVVLLQNSVEELPKVWQEPQEGIHLIDARNVGMPVDWIVHAPFEGPARIEKKDNEVTVRPERT
jgi:hypothetical protein